MITISINPQTPAHMAILSKALIALLADDAAPEVVAETPKKPRKVAEPAHTLPAPVTVTATPTPEPAPVEVAAASPSKPITLEEVRAKLAALSQAGKTAEVKALIGTFGAGKLTDIAADKYAEVLVAAEAI